MPRGKPLTKSEKQAIRRDYTLGRPTRDILKKFGISRSTMNNVVKKKGRERPPLRITRRDQDVIATMNFRGFSDKAISGMTGVPESTVRWHRNKMGLPVVPAETRRA